VKGGLFTCKCDKPNCSFSDETIKSLRIDDSDNEEIELDGNSEQSKTEKNKLLDDKMLIQEVSETSKTVRNSLRQRNRLSLAKNLLQQKTDCSSPSSSDSSSVRSLQKNDSKEANIISIPKNEPLGKTKTITVNSVVKNKEPPISESNQLLKVIDKRSSKHNRSKLIQNKCNQDVLKKGLGDKLSNGNTRPSIGKKILLTGKKVSVETTEKQKLCNGSKVSPGSIKSTNNKAIQNYVLRRKALNSNKKISKNIPSDSTSPNNVFNRRYSLINPLRVGISSDTPSRNLKMTRDSKNSDQLINFIKTVRIGEESKTKPNIVNGQHKRVERQRTSVSEEVKVEPNDELYIINGCIDERFPHTDQER